jgi:hypothetical protein
MPTLKNMVGETIMARIRALDKEDMVLVKLHKVEASGIWVESQDFTETVMSRCEIAASRTTVIMFIPFHGVDYILGSVDSMSLSEKAFGLGEDCG